MEPYQKLSEIYAYNWGDFSIQYLDIVDYLKKEFKYIPKKILDISCGTGELLRELHKQGYHVTGSDISESMIKVAKEANKDIDFYVGDMAQVQINSTFDLVISAFDSINYILDKIHLAKVFSNVNGHLNMGAYFIFDINTPLMFRDNHHGVIEQDFNGMIVTKMLSYNREERIAKTVFDFGETLIEEHVQRAYKKAEMEKLLKSNGFEICKLMKDFDFSEVDESSYRIIFIARKIS